MVSENDFSTPMMKQYAHIKAQYPDTLLFFRLGDFYELFMEDAETGAEVLDITLTARDKGSDGKIPMCGVPFHAVDSYISRLVAAGYKVAICEQISSADDATGIVERDVVRVVTPSTILDENAVPRKETNYLMVLDIDPNIKSQTIGVAFVDLGTSDFQIVEIAIDADRRALEDLVTKFTPKECIISPKNYENVRFISWLRKFPGLNIYPFGHWREYATDPESYLRKIYEIASVEGIGLKDSEKLQRVTALAVGYLNETQKGRVHHLSKPQKYHMEQYLEMDSSTIFNLELFHTIREGDREGSLLWLLDKSKTAMGGRLLRHWIVRPSRVREELVSRHDFVEYMFSRNSFRTQVQDWLESVLDIERILGRLSVGTGNARDLVGLRQSLVAIKEIIGETNQHEVPLFKLLGEAFTTRVTNILSLIEKSILDEPSALMREGNMIRDGYSEALDELRSIKNTGQGYLDRFLEEQKQITGIPNLKVGSNKVFGFYLEVSKSHTDKVPPQYVRKQTLVNAERYITQELKEYEDKVLGAEEKISELEYELVQQVIEKVLSDTADLFTLSKIIGKIDVLTGFAEISERNNYVKPMLFDDDRLVLEDSRHPVIEQLLEDQSFVPNDVSMDSETRQIILLTGPNMAGKSTYIRQVAICALIAHLGCFVPCRKAEIGIVDKLFTRIGAADNLSRGLSTFMVEMVEVANILNNATSKSLIILDEVGRGTSTYDGVSIAWAVVEYLAENEMTRPKTLFATHYHELLQMSEMYDHIYNYQVVVEMEGDELHFLHRVMAGGTDKSYGIQVAKRAGIPQDVIERAVEILSGLENKQTASVHSLKSRGQKRKQQPKESDHQQSSLF